jgi:hypothetical protein
MDVAPIILFVYNRPWHTRQTLQALALNKRASDSVLYIYADGPKENASEEDLKKIKETRAVLKETNWCKEVIIREGIKNKGLANSVIEGITEVIEKHGKIIVLEDDLLTSPYFLEYCNEGLEMYQDDTNVYAINAYQFPIQSAKTDTFLCPLATSSWGWATWKDKWKYFNKNQADKLLIQNHPFLSQRFNFADYNYTDMLDNTKSWAIHWYCSVFKRNGLGLFPTQSLVANIGFDGSGENCGVATIKQQIHTEKIKLEKKEAIDLEMYAALLDHFTVKKKNLRLQDMFLNFFKQ